VTILIGKAVDISEFIHKKTKGKEDIMKRWIVTISQISSMIALLILGFSCTEKEWVEPQVIPESQVQAVPSVSDGITAPDVAGSTHALVPVPIIEVYPHFIDFGPVGVGIHARRPLVIRNAGNMPLRVTSIEMKAQEDAFAFSSPYQLPFTVLPRPGSGVIEPSLDGSADVLVYVTFTPPTLGWYTGVLYLRSSDPEEPVIGIRLEGGGVMNTQAVPHSYMMADTL
jgi:hypothetical protein